MDLTNISTIKRLLKKHNLWAKKRLGQHFLIDKEALSFIIKTADLKKGNVVLEIGPGIGVLTQELCQRAKRVIVVEKDEDMMEILEETCGQYKNLEIINEDILKVNSKQVTDNSSNYKIVANLPYYITSPITRKFLESEIKPKEMVLMIQKEVAERICAKPREMSILAVSVQFYGEPEIIRVVKKESFWPHPKVDSAILHISVNGYMSNELMRMFPHQPLNTLTRNYFKVVKAGFGERRKKLINSLSGGLQLDKTMLEKLLRKAKINPGLRAQDLGLDDWKKIYDILEKEKIL